MTIVSSGSAFDEDRIRRLRVEFKRRRRLAVLLGGGLATLGAGGAAAHHLFASGAPEEPRIEFAFEEPTSANTHITDTISLGVELEVEYAAETDYDLDGSSDDDEQAVKPAARLFASYEPSEKLRAFGKFEFSQDFFLDHPDGDDPDAKLTVAEAYLAFHDVAPGLSLIVGRQDIEDEREWVSDQVLDGVRVVQRFGEEFALEAMAMRQELVQSDILGDHRDDRQDNLYVRGYWGFSEDAQASFYVLDRKARGDRDADLLFFGLQSFGEITKNIDYWAEAAYVTGEARDDRDISGFGVDVGGTYVFKGTAFEPSATLGFAFGTGDDGGSTDTAFRQSGMHDNNGRFNGVTSFEYYGLALEPELSNMAIFTAGMGIRPTRRSSVDLVYHKYLLDERADKLRDSSLSADPNGDSRDLGQALDLVVGVRDIENVAIEGVAGLFFPGDAFDEDDAALRLGLQVRVGF